MDLTCIDCGAPIQRRVNHGPLPKRCDNCRREVKLKKTREWKRDKRQGKTRPGRHPDPRRCDECEKWWERITAKPGIRVGEQALLMLEGHGYLVSEDDAGGIYPYRREDTSTNERNRYA